MSEEQEKKQAEIDANNELIDRVRYLYPVDVPFGLHEALSTQELTKIRNEAQQLRASFSDIKGKLGRGEKVDPKNDDLWPEFSRGRGNRA